MILHGSVVHYSLENTSEYPRHAYSVHVIEGNEGYNYPPENWLQRPPEYPFRDINDIAYSTTSKGGDTV